MKQFVSLGLLALCCAALGAAPLAAQPGDQTSPAYRASLDLALADFDGGTTVGIVSVPADRVPGGSNENGATTGGGQGRKPVVIESMKVTCNGADTCDGSTTCDGQPTCNGIITCNGADTCDGSTTCNGAQTCDGSSSCNGAETCDGTQTCNGTGTCNGASSCQDTCSGFYTCTVGCNSLVAPGHGGSHLPKDADPLELLMASVLTLGSLAGSRRFLGLA